MGALCEDAIILGTTTDAFFTLERLARFLKAAPLGLRLALNLDGGPVACQGSRSAATVAISVADGSSPKKAVRRSFGRLSSERGA